MSLSKAWFEDRGGLHDARVTSVLHQGARLDISIDDEWANADVNARNEDGDTALHWAAQNGDYEMARLLIEHGASPPEKNDEGLTPLDLALSQGHDALFLLLRSAE